MNSQNNEFWTALDSLVSQCEIIIDRPKGSKHPRFDFVYEVDYGFLEGTSASDCDGIDIWKGSGNNGVDAIICTIDLLKKDSEIKILLNCTDDEKQKILAFHNNSQFMKGILVEREENFK